MSTDLLNKGFGSTSDALVLGGMGGGEESPVTPAAALEVHVMISVADPYPLPRLSYVVPAAELEAHVTVNVATKRPRLSYVGAVLPPTDDLGWTTPDVTAPALQGLTVTLDGHNVPRALIVEPFIIELSDCGGPISATMTLARDVRLAATPMLSQLVVTYKGQRLFKGRLEARGLDLGSDMANTLTFTGPIRQLGDHRAYRRVYVDSDLDNWRCDQGPNTAANVFEVTASE